MISHINAYILYDRLVNSNEFTKLCTSQPYSKYSLTAYLFAINMVVCRVCWPLLVSHCWYFIYSCIALPFVLLIHLLPYTNSAYNLIIYIINSELCCIYKLHYFSISVLIYLLFSIDFHTLILIAPTCILCITITRFFPFCSMELWLYSLSPTIYLFPFHFIFIFYNHLITLCFSHTLNSLVFSSF